MYQVQAKQGDGSWVTIFELDESLEVSADKIAEILSGGERELRRINSDGSTVTLGINPRLEGV